jgi:DNA-directed RNA polymerase alpha subunit
MEDKKLIDLDFSVRALNCFKQNNFTSLKDITNLEERDFKKLNFSNRTIKEIIQYKTIHQLKSETNIGISAEEKLRQLILSTPNDQELGKIIRELYGKD